MEKLYDFYDWVKNLKEFKKSNGKLPETMDKAMNGIKKALYLGDWNDFDTFSMILGKSNAALYH